MAAERECEDVLQQIGCAVGGVQDAIGGAIDTAGFWTDPWGNTFKALQDSARNFSETVLPAITKATLPDLSADWFLRTYAVTFALAIFVAVVLLFPQILRTARGHQSGRELADSIGLYFPLFLVAASFGPPIGALLVNFFGSLTDSIAAWGITGTAETVTDKFQSMLSEGDAAGIIGGAPVGVMLMLLMLLGLLLVFVVLIVQLVTLYFTGVLLPLGIVWIIDPTKRSFGLRIVAIWLGVLASHPLLFLLLSFAYLMVGSNVDVFSSDNTLQKSVTLVVSLLALFMAGLSPFALMKLAPVLPMGNTGARSPSLPDIGPRNLSEADARYNPSAAPSSSRPQENAPSPGADLVASNGGRPAVATATAPEATGAATTTEAAAAARAGAGAATATAGSAGAATAAESVAAAGVAESSTGVGAAIGIPTTIAAGAIAGATAAKDAADRLSDQAAAPVGDQDETYGKDGLQ